MIRRLAISALSSALLIGLTACATSVTYTPEPPAAARPEPPPADARRSEPVENARLEIEGDPRYLPTRLADALDSHPDLSYRYRSSTRYRHSSTMAQLFNPLMLFGFRGLGMNVTATAHLDVLREGEIIERMDASCVVKMRHGIWTWGYPRQSELRTRALVAVRDMIDVQLENH